MGRSKHSGGFWKEEPKKDTDDRKVDQLAGEESLADKLKKRRKTQQERLDEIMGK